MTITPSFESQRWSSRLVQARSQASVQSSSSPDNESVSGRSKNPKKGPKMSGTKRKQDSSVALAEQADTNAKRTKNADSSSPEVGANDLASSADQDAAHQEVSSAPGSETAPVEDTQGKVEGVLSSLSLSSADGLNGPVLPSHGSEQVLLSTQAIHVDSGSELSDMDLDDMEDLRKEAPVLTTEQLAVESIVKDDAMSPDNVTLASSAPVQQNGPQVEQTYTVIRRSGRASKVPARLHGNMTVDDLEMLDTATSTRDHEGKIDVSPKRSISKTATGRNVKPKLETPQASTPKSASRQRKTPQKRVRSTMSKTPASTTIGTISASRQRKTPQKKVRSTTSKTPVSTTVVTISTFRRPKLSRLLSEKFPATSTARAAATRLPPSPPSSQGSFAPELDADLLRLSKALTFREPLDSKPLPQGRPLVWADSRQALIETVPYFKKPQGGCHSNDHHVYAFLFDGVGHCREYMDSDVIIARAGGGMEADSIGGMVQGKNQSMTEPQVLAVLNDAELQNPLIIVCGEKNVGSQTKMPHKYCVLGWYKPVSVWAEKTTGKGKVDYITIKYRLERLNAAEAAWHAPSDVKKSGADSSIGPHKIQTCAHCAKQWPQVYLISWLCLNAACEYFWTLPSGRDAPSGALDYNPAFLMARTNWDVEAEPFSVRPPLPDVGQAIGANLTYINTRGICCPNCGRCNHRYLFSGWICDNPNCSWEGLEANHQPIMPASLHQPWDNFGEGPSLGRNKHEVSVHLAVSYSHGYKVYKYTFEGIEGSFIHAVANTRVTRERDGPDDMLAAVQTSDMDLERRRFKGEKSPNKKLTTKKTMDKAPKLRSRPCMARVQPLTPESEDAPETLEVAQPPEVTDPSVDAQVHTLVPETASSMEVALTPNNNDTDIVTLLPTVDNTQAIALLPTADDASIHAAVLEQSGEADKVGELRETWDVARSPEVAESSVDHPAHTAVPETASSMEVALIPDTDDTATHTADSEPADGADEGGEADEADISKEIDAGDFMTAFSMNYGMPYKFVATGASKSFDDSPWPVRACRSRLNWAQRTFLDDRTGDVDFNEELIFAYMEGQKIDYHDDGEEGLGARIATLSLGGRAKMHLRMKMKHFVGCSKTGLLTVGDKPPVPGGLGGREMDEKRVAAWNELQRLKDTDKAQFQKRLKELPKELKADPRYLSSKCKDRSLYGNRNQKASDLITVTLGHGDIVLMEGYEIQKYLEHKVVPEGYLRFAMTCRTVLETHLKPEERPPYEVKADDWGYDGSGLL